MYHSLLDDPRIVVNFEQTIAVERLHQHQWLFSCYRFNYFKSNVMFDCIGPENNYYNIKMFNICWPQVIYFLFFMSQTSIQSCRDGSFWVEPVLRRG